MRRMSSGFQILGTLALLQTILPVLSLAPRQLFIRPRTLTELEIMKGLAGGGGSILAALTKKYLGKMFLKFQSPASYHGISFQTETDFFETRREYRTISSFKFHSRERWWSLGPLPSYPPSLPCPTPPHCPLAILSPHPALRGCWLVWMFKSSMGLHSLVLISTNNAESPRNAR